MCALTHSGRVLRLAASLTIVALASLSCSDDPAPAPRAEVGIETPAIPTTDGTAASAATGESDTPSSFVPPGAPVSDEARRKIDEFIHYLQPLPKELTSDHHDRWFWRYSELARRLEKDAPEVGWAALHAFTNYPERDFHTKRNLLRVGARAAPEEARGLLEKLAFTYGFPIEDRSEAILLLAEVAPQRALERLRPYLLRRQPLRETLPNDEFLVRAWIIAHHEGGTTPVDVLSDVATNLMMESYARIVALRELAQHDLTPESRGALQTTLVESNGDGMVRRVAAQSIVAGYARENACSLLEQVLEVEADPAMRTFLTDLVLKNCR